MIMIFFKLGFISFGGGWTAIGILKEEMVSNGLLSLSQFNEAVSIAQMTPGPVAVNVATYVGYNSYGLLGAVLNTFFLILPPIIFFNVALFILKRLKINKTKLLNALKLGTLLLITFSFASLVESGLNSGNYMIFLISLISFLFFIFTRIDPIMIILGSAVIGIFLF